MEQSVENRLDQFLMHPPTMTYRGSKRCAVEFLWFGIKEARACLFAGLFFLSIFCVPRTGLFGIARYDLLLMIALTIQFIMVATRLESWDELKAITLFHLLGIGLELFKTSAAIGSWHYPEAAWSKVAGVPLFSGFMYAAVGSYIIQCWRLMDLKIRHHPPIIHAVLLSLALYANFFTHHFIGDYRWYIAAVALGLYARSEVIFTPYD
ncbi:membrane protein, partial [Pantoea rodasii]